jgi:hypothetical protein
MHAKRKAPSDNAILQIPAATAARPTSAAAAARPHRHKPDVDAVVFTTPEGEAVKVDDWPDDLEYAILQANEAQLAEIWDSPEEDEGCRRLLEGT